MLLIISGGGNDIGFAYLVTSCILHHDCSRDLRTLNNACLGTDWTCINNARIHLVRGFIESGEFRNGKPAFSNPTSTAQYNEEYVRQLYLTLLRRPADQGGLTTYVNELNATGDYDHTVHGFINATEYRVRFGPQ